MAAKRRAPSAAPEAAAAGERSQTIADRFSASSEANIQTVGVEVADGQVAQRLAELGVLDTLLDLAALAVVVLEFGGGLLGGVIGEDEAVAEDREHLALERQLQLLGVNGARLGDD